VSTFKRRRRDGMVLRFTNYETRVLASRQQRTCSQESGTGSRKRETWNRVWLSLVGSVFWVSWVPSVLRRCWSTIRHPTHTTYSNRFSSCSCGTAEGSQV